MNGSRNCGQFSAIIIPAEAGMMVIHAAFCKLLGNMLLPYDHCEAVLSGFAACFPWSCAPISGMESHEWFQNTDDGKVYYRANYLGTRWTIMTTMQKRDPTWTDLKPPPEAVWRELRDIVWKKYQRKRCPWERVADIDRILGDEPPAR